MVIQWEEAFERIREEMDLPPEFPAAALEEAESSARKASDRSSKERRDFSEIPFLTIDPATSRDLDQAFAAERDGDGYRVRYAIADVGFYVQRGGALEQEAWKRGETYYSPDLKTPLYPFVISEGAASLLPDVVRPAIVFDFSLGPSAEKVSLSVERAFVRSRAKLAYSDVSLHLAQERAQKGTGALAGSEWSEQLSLLEEIGRKREQLEAERGGVSLRIPAQQIQRWTTAVTGYRLAFESSVDVEGWNAQISLMTGIGAAEMMLAAGVGLLRLLDPPRPDRLRAFRLTAVALGVPWPEETAYDDFVRSLDPQNPTHAVLLHQAARVTGGARYAAFDGKAPAYYLHAGVAAPYAHVTAPLRRLADRYVLDLLVALSSGTPPAAELLDAIERLPQIMAKSDNLARRLESALVDFVEARLMQNRIGERFDAVVIALRADGAAVQISEPPIRTLLTPDVFNRESPGRLSDDGTSLTFGETTISLGESLSLELVKADPASRRLVFKRV
jgi:exoribonuclease R